MFKVGDKVICIDEKYKKKYDIFKKTYIVKSYFKNDNQSYNCDLIFLDYERYGFNACKFMSITEYRKLKLLKLNKNDK